MSVTYPPFENQSLFQLTLTALELHLAELENGNMVLTSQLSGKEDIHSMDKMTIMRKEPAAILMRSSFSDFWIKYKKVIPEV